MPPDPSFGLMAATSSAMAASQSQAQDGVETDPRFSELLRPIKDLTQNWEVPLARYLEDYISELSDLNINLARGQNAKVGRWNEYFFRASS